MRKTGSASDSCRLCLDGVGGRGVRHLHTSRMRASNQGWAVVQLSFPASADPSLMPFSEDQGPVMATAHRSSLHIRTQRGGGERHRSSFLSHSEPRTESLSVCPAETCCGRTGNDGDLLTAWTPERLLGSYFSVSSTGMKGPDRDWGARHPPLLP